MRPLRSRLRSRPLLTRRQRATVRRPRSSSQQRRPPRRCECGPSAAAAGALPQCRSPTHTPQTHPASLRTLHLPVHFPLLSLLLPAPLGTFLAASHAAPVATPLPRVSSLLPSTTLGVCSIVNKGSHVLPNQYDQDSDQRAGERGGVVHGLQLPVRSYAGGAAAAARTAAAQHGRRCPRQHCSVAAAAYRCGQVNLAAECIMWAGVCSVAFVRLAFCLALMRVTNKCDFLLPPHVPCPPAVSP